MSSDFKVGDEVVCINNTPMPTTPQYRYPTLELIEVGKVYIIEALRINPWDNSLGVQLVGVDTQNGNWYDHCRFRKVQKKFTGMEILTGLLLTPSKELEHAE